MKRLPQGLKPSYLRRYVGAETPTPAAFVFLHAFKASHGYEKDFVLGGDCEFGGGVWRRGSSVAANGDRKSGDARLQSAAAPTKGKATAEATGIADREIGDRQEGAKAHSQDWLCHTSLTMATTPIRRNFLRDCDYISRASIRR